MPLIQCPDCQKEISDKAPACIHCGRSLISHPSRYRPALKQKLNQTAWLLFIAAVLVGVGATSAESPALYGVAGLCFLAAVALAIAYYLV
jgi:predicted glycosyltransferase